MRHKDQRDYEGDVFYDVWRSGGNPDRISHDRVEKHYYNGDEASQAAAHELRIQRETRQAAQLARWEADMAEHEQMMEMQYQQQRQEGPLSQLARNVIDEVTYMQGLVETEKTTISNRSNKLHTLSSVYQATKTLLSKSKRSKISDEEQALAISFWEEAGKLIPDWSLAAEKKVACAELRRDYVHAHGIALQALGGMGVSLLAEEPKQWKRRLKPLADLDWKRTNPDWEGRALVAGKVSKAITNVMLTTNYLKQFIGLPLSATEQQCESKYLKFKKSKRSE